MWRNAPFWTLKGSHHIYWETHTHTHLELLHGLAELFGRLVCEVSLQGVFLSLVDPLLHLLHLLPQSHRLIEASFQSRLLSVGLEHTHTQMVKHVTRDSGTTQRLHGGHIPVCRRSPTDCWVRPAVSGCRRQTAARPLSSGTRPLHWCHWRWVGWCGCHSPEPGQSERRMEVTLHS